MKITTVVQFEGETYRFDALRLAEARLIKQITTLSDPQQFSKALFSNDPDAVTALVLIMRRRNGETGLRFADIDGDLSTYSVELRDEKGREVTVKLGDPDEDGERQPVFVNGQPVMLFDGVEEVEPDPTQESAPAPLEPVAT
jgi:hypothetical protein